MGVLWKAMGDIGLVFRALHEAENTFLPTLANSTASEFHATAMVAALLIDTPMNEIELEDMASRIRDHDHFGLVNEIFGNCPEGLFDALGKLECALFSANDYKWILRAAFEPQASMMFVKMREVSRDQLGVMRALNDPFRRPSIVASISSATNARYLMDMVSIIKTLNQSISDEEISQSLETEIGIEGFDIHEWYEGWILRSPFPEAPWTGNEQITPVDNSRSLKAVAQRLNEDWKFEFIDVFARKSYFYIWKGDNEALIQLERDFVFGWGIAGIHDIKKQPMKPEHVIEITRMFEAGGISNFRTLQDPYPQSSNF